MALVEMNFAGGIGGSEITLRDTGTFYASNKSVNTGVPNDADANIIFVYLSSNHEGNMKIQNKNGELVDYSTGYSNINIDLTGSNVVIKNTFDSVWDPYELTWKIYTY